MLHQNNNKLKPVIFFIVCVFVFCFCCISYKNRTSYLDKFNNDLSRAICAKIQIPRSRVRQNGEFWILENYIKASKTFDYLESITYTIHGEYRFFNNLQEVAKRWHGPISVAVYAPGIDFNRTLRSIDYLRTCVIEKNLIQEFITFHIFFPASHMPPFIPKSEASFKSFAANCCETPPYIREANESYRHNHSMLYPINVARNIARGLATTHFVFPSDIEMYPNFNFVDEFLDFVHRKPDLLIAERQVYALAVFEVDRDEEVPNSKTDLQEMLHTEKAIPFHKTICMDCHAIPGLDSWINAKETAQLDIFSTVKHHSFWEPFYVTTNLEPFFDERYTWEGRYDKQIQADVLGMMNYSFCILNNAFLVHRPGIKKHGYESPEVTKMLLRTSQEIVPQLRILHA